ncbi:MAG: anti-sigma factor family protein [Pseudomonas sp.]
MLTCKQQVAKSSDYIDNALGMRERLAVRYHLMLCPNCRRYIRQLRLVSATLKRMPEAPPDDIDSTVESLVREHAVKRST